ncbi:hypothetical protein FSP39_000109 [Pinctada imbricata]|uniref:acid phosphatase n=1 Tax=Pinctada imbricata TaxID=66713 RepID=A0AA88YWD5_PINIB|nr:hypothetical protein FSP39_000109 [Pinctada imbricata]
MDMEHVERDWCIYECYLISALFLFRHGDRSPTHTYPKDTFQEDSWPQGWGQLTQKGMQHEYMLGQFLRDRYVKSGFLNGTYIREKIRIRSTDKDRTLMSAYTVLAGLFPAHGTQRWNKNMTWQPIPVHTIPLNDDHLIYTNSPCPAADKLLKQWKESSPWLKKLKEKYKDLVQYVSDNTGLPNTLDDILGIVDTLFIEYDTGKFNNDTMPDWLKKDGTFWKMMSLRDVHASMGLPHVPQIAKLRAGTLVRHLAENMTAKVNTKDSPSQDLLIYSAHDSTVIALLSALKLYNYRQPPYCTTVLIELYAKPSGNFVKIFIRNGTDPESKEYNKLHTLKLKGCSIECPLKKFVALQKSVIVKDIKKECHLDRVTSNRDKPSADRVVGLAILSSVTLLLLIILTATCVILCKQRNRLGNYRPLPTKYDDDDI